MILDDIPHTRQVWVDMENTENTENAHWGLHRKERQDLKEVVLDDITNDAILIEVSAAPLCPEVLTEDDL